MFGTAALDAVMAATAYATISRVHKTISKFTLRTEDKIRLVKSTATAKAALIAMVCTVMICDEEQVPYAGLRPEPRYFYEISKRPMPLAGMRHATQKSPSGQPVEAERLRCTASSL